MLLNGPSRQDPVSILSPPPPPLLFLHTCMHAVWDLHQLITHTSLFFLLCLTDNPHRKKSWLCITCARQEKSHGWKTKRLLPKPGSATPELTSPPVSQRHPKCEVTRSTEFSEDLLAIDFCLVCLSCITLMSYLRLIRKQRMQILTACITNNSCGFFFLLPLPLWLPFARSTDTHTCKSIANAVVTMPPA